MFTREFDKEKTTIFLDPKKGHAMIRSPFIETGNNLLKKILKEPDLEKFELKSLTYMNFGNLIFMLRQKNDIDVFINTNSLPDTYIPKSKVKFSKLVEENQNISWSNVMVFIVCVETKKFLFFENGFYLEPFSVETTEADIRKVAIDNLASLGYNIKNDSQLTVVETFEDNSSAYIIGTEREKSFLGSTWLSYKQIMKHDHITQNIKEIFKKDECINDLIEEEDKSWAEDVVDDIIS